MKQPKNSLLWRIEAPALPGASYLFGTMHVQDLRAFAAAQLAFEKIRACEGFAAEFHLDEAQQPGILSSKMPEGQHLDQLLPAKKYQKLRLFLRKSNGLDIDDFRQYSPFFIVNLLNSKALQATMPVALDEHLWNFARSEGKALFGIETLAEQVEALKKIPLEMQLDMLLAAGRQTGTHRSGITHLANLYEKGDLQLLYKVVKRQSHGLRRLLIFQRNEVMADRIFDLAKQRTLFAAIGAAHLAGRKGVLKLLKDKGLKIQPIFTEVIVKAPATARSLNSETSSSLSCKATA